MIPRDGGNILTGSLFGVISGDDLSLSTTGNFADKNAGAGKAVTIDWSLSGAVSDPNGDVGKKPSTDR